MDILITSGERHLFEWQRGMSGSFFTALFELFAKADNYNLSRLENAYPSEVAAFQRYRSEPGYWDDVQSRYMEWIESNR